MENMNPAWVAVGMTIIVQVVALAMNYGTMRSSMKWMQEEIQKLWSAHRETSATTSDLNVRVGRIEGVCEERHGAHHQPARPSRSNT